MVQVDLQHAVGFLLTILTLAGIVVAGLRWLKRWLHRTLVEPVTAVRTEVTPSNGEERNGSLREMVGRIAGAVSTLEQRFADHLHYHDRHDE